MLAAGVVFGILGLLVRIAPIRALLLRLVKKSGDGPSEAAMRQHWFKLHFIAACAGKIVQTEVAGGDPGYVETAKMLAEAGMCLAQDRGVLPARAGVRTPVEAMGEVLLARFAAQWPWFSRVVIARSEPMTDSTLATPRLTLGVP